MLFTLNCGFGRSSFRDFEKNFLAGTIGTFTASEAEILSLGEIAVLVLDMDLSGDVDRRVKCE